MDSISKKNIEVKNLPIKVLQFGEGNFLRAFSDMMIDICNEKGLFSGGIVIVKPREHGDLSKFKEQKNLYTVSLRGRVDGEPKVYNRLITSVSDTLEIYKEYDRFKEYASLDSLRFVISNTTEAGIVFDVTDEDFSNPPKTFPGKLTVLLYERFMAFNGNADKGLIMLPAELIDDNGKVLFECVKKYIELWKLPADFLKWVEEACVFASTLVDRIVTGFPKNPEEIYEEIGYEDKLLVAAEPFASWIIESEKDFSGELPLKEAGLPVVFTDNLKPYKQRKVRILNGAHTSFVPASFLAGNDIVRESMEDELIRSFMNETLFDEVIPTLDLPASELKEFADAVINRFNNPYVDHALLAIALNSVSKWKARCLPSFLEYANRKGEVPKHLAFSIAALMAFYSSDKLSENALLGNRNGEEYKIMDDAFVLEFFRDNSKKSSEELVNAFLENESFLGTDLTKVYNTRELVTGYLEEIRNSGMRKAMEKYFA